jgi:hypothetical protein
MFYVYLNEVYIFLFVGSIWVPQIIWIYLRPDYKNLPPLRYFISQSVSLLGAPLYSKMVADNALAIETNRPFALFILLYIGA